MQDLSAADWLTSTDADPLRLITFGPAAFEAYARLRYIPDPDRPELSESDVLLPEDHPSDIEQARIVLKALAQHTGTAAQCFYCVWDGWVGFVPHWAAIGATARVIDSLTRRTDVDVVRASPEQPPLRYAS
jgi:hypothetical protein